MGTINPFRVLGTGLLIGFTREQPWAAAHIEPWVAEVESRNWADHTAFLQKFPQARVRSANELVFVIGAGRFGINTLINYHARFLLVVKLARLESEDSPSLFDML